MQQTWQERRFHNGGGVFFMLQFWEGGYFWLGREDSNLRMAESKSAALPLGYAPTLRP